MSSCSDALDVKRGRSAQKIASAKIGKNTAIDFTVKSW